MELMEVPASILTSGCCVCGITYFPLIPVFSLGSRGNVDCVGLNSML